VNSTATGLIVFAALCGAVFLGMRLRIVLPEHHLSEDTKDAVKLGIGMVVTMAALVLGLLVASAKGAYDAQRGEVTQMAAKVAFLDHMLALYGPSAGDARARLRAAVDGAVKRIWAPEGGGMGRLAANFQAGDAVFSAIQALAADNETQRNLKMQAAAAAADLGQLRSLLLAQSVSSVSKPLVVFLIIWLFFAFLSFGLYAPANATATTALVVSALSVSAAIFLILELDQPFRGLVQIPSDTMVQILQHLGR
jgi:hypothetical protein